MVLCSPEPPNEADEVLTLPTDPIIVASDDSEEEAILTPVGYQLLSQDNLTADATSESEEASDNEEVGISERVQFTNGVMTSQLSVEHQSEIAETVELFSDTSGRADIVVDCDVVKAAMSGITLPPTAIPSWAANVPPSQLDQHLRTLLNRLQGNRTAI